MSTIAHVETQQIGQETVQVRERGSWFSPGRVIAFVAGGVLVFIGAVAVYRTGVDNDLTKPQTEVFSIGQSALFGLIEVTAGLLLILSAMSEAARSVAGVLGVFAIIAGIAGLAASAELQFDVGFSRSTGWFFVIWGITALVSSLLPAVWTTRRDVDVVA